MDRSNIQNIYPLSPLGEALLFRRLGSPENDPGFLQIRLSLTGRIDPDFVSRAWQYVTDRHEILRSSVHWEDTKRPLQVVRNRVEADFSVVDWENSLDDFLARDAEAGVDLTKAPYDRLQLVRMSEGSVTLVWSTHHILSDGWSSAVIFGELVRAYVSFINGDEPGLPPAPSKKAYQQWLESRDPESARSFWSSYLGGTVLPTEIPRSRPGRPSEHPFPSLDLELGSELDDQVRRLVSNSECTVGGVLQLALAVCMSSLGAGDDVVFGMIFSGRPPEIAGVERMTGLFSSSLPIRMRLDAGATVREHCRNAMRESASVIRHGFVPIEEISELVDVVRGPSLFDTLFVLENFPMEDAGASGSGAGFEITGLEGMITTTLPLTFAAIDEPGLPMRLVYDPAEITDDDARIVAERFKLALNAVSRDSDRSLSEIMTEVPQLPLDGADEDRHEIVPTDRKNDTSTVGPSDQIELRLMRIWSEVLGLGSVTPMDDFFDLGGRSIQAVRMFNHIEREFGKKLPISAIFEARTIRAMADFLTDETDVGRRDWRTLVPIQPMGDRTPIFCIHAAHGNVNFYFDLVERLDPDQPAFGIQSLGLEGDEEPLRSIDEMGDLYAREIHSLQGNEPCVLCGTCLGVTIAAEVAARLSEMGTPVELIIAFDGTPFGSSARESEGEQQTAPTDSSLVGKVGRNLRRLLQGDFDYIRRRVRLHRRLLYRRLRGHWLEWLGTDRDRWQHAVWQANFEAVTTTYVSAPVNTPVLFVYSSGLAESRPQYARNWENIATGELEIVELETTHWGMFEVPAVDELASLVSDRLGRLETISGEPMRT